MALLCLSSQAHVRGQIEADDEDIADYCEFNSTQDWLYYRDKLIAKGMLEINANGKLQVLHWEDMQRPDNPYGRLPANEWRIVRDRIFERDGYTCQYCGALGGHLHCDHAIPISRGGTNDLSNLVTACKRCNLSKHTRTPEEWRGM